MSPAHQLHSATPLRNGRNIITLPTKLNSIRRTSVTQRRTWISSKAAGSMKLFDRRGSRGNEDTQTYEERRIVPARVMPSRMTRKFAPALSEPQIHIFLSPFFFIFSPDGDSIDANTAIVIKISYAHIFIRGKSCSREVRKMRARKMWAPAVTHLTSVCDATEGTVRPSMVQKYFSLWVLYAMIRISNIYSIVWLKIAKDKKLSA